jgi:hypothetical protein
MDSPLRALLKLPQGKELLAERQRRQNSTVAARVRRARSRAERRAGLAGALPLFCTQRWASAKMQDAACRHGPAGSRELESFGKATLHGQGRALGYTSRSLGHCGLVMEGPAREDGSGTRSSRRSARAGEARVSRAVATLAGVAGRSSRQARSFIEVSRRARAIFAGYMYMHMYM